MLAAGRPIRVSRPTKGPSSSTRRCCLVIKSLRCCLVGWLLWFVGLVLVGLVVLLVGWFGCFGLVGWFAWLMVGVFGLVGWVFCLVRLVWFVCAGCIGLFVWLCLVALVTSCWRMLSKLVPCVAGDARFFYAPSDKKT